MNVLHNLQSPLEHTFSFDPHSNPLGAGTATIVLHLRDLEVGPGALCFISHSDTEQHMGNCWGHEHGGELLGKTSSQETWELVCFVPPAAQPGHFFQSLSVGTTAWEASTPGFMRQGEGEDSEGGLART